MFVFLCNVHILTLDLVCVIALIKLNLVHSIMLSSPLMGTPL